MFIPETKIVTQISVRVHHRENKVHVKRTVSRVAERSDTRQLHRAAVVLYIRRATFEFSVYVTRRARMINVSSRSAFKCCSRMGIHYLLYGSAATVGDRNIALS